MTSIPSSNKSAKSDTQHNSADSLRLELLHQLWKIKQGLEHTNGHSLQMTQLRKDPGLLKSVLKEAAESSDAEVRQAAARIMDLLAQGVVLDPDWSLDDVSALLQKPEGSSAPSSPPGSSAKRHGSWQLVLLVVLVVGALVAAAVVGWRTYVNEPAAAVASAPKASPAQVVLRIRGSNTLGAELLPAMAEAFLKKEGAPSVRRIEVAPNEWRIEGVTARSLDPVAIEIQAHGSGTAFKALLDGTADIGAASRPIKTEEAQALSRYGDMGSPAIEHVVGLDGIAVIVNKSNPVRRLTREQIAKIFSGEIKDWVDVGGTPGPIHLFARDDKSGTYDTFQSLVLGHAKLDSQSQRLESSEELSDRVAADSFAIGFIGLPYVRDARAIAVSEDAATLPMLPTPFTVATEDYALARRLYLYAPPNPQRPYLQSFLEFALSDTGQHLVNQAGFVSQIVETARPPVLDSFPEEMRRLVTSAERLSLSIRFRSESDALDSKAQRDLDRLVDFLAHRPGRRIMLLGFADAQGDSARNLALSKQRAQEVERELMSRGIFPQVVKGFGAAAPLAGDASPQNALRNRRVEIWMM